MSCSPTVEGKYDIEEVKGKLFPLGMVGGWLLRQKREKGNLGTKTCSS